MSRDVNVYNYRGREAGAAVSLVNDAVYLHDFIGFFRLWG